jgi:hypothetical protein
VVTVDLIEFLRARLDEDEPPGTPYLQQSATCGASVREVVERCATKLAAGNEAEQHVAGAIARIQAHWWRDHSDYQADWATWCRDDLCPMCADTTV